MDWLQLYNKIGKQHIKNLHSSIQIMIGKDFYSLKLKFNDKNEPYFIINRILTLDKQTEI